MFAEVPEDMKTRYAAIFGSQIGVYVLADLLLGYGLFAILDPDKPGQIARHNAAIELLGQVGILRPTNENGQKKQINQVAMERIVEALMGIRE